MTDNAIRKILLAWVIAIIFIWVAIAGIKIKSLEREITELQQEMEAYRDNYTALWVTINNMQK